MKLDDVIYAMRFTETAIPTEETIEAALGYLRDYKDLLLILRMVSKDMRYVEKYLKELEDEDLQ